MGEKENASRAAVFLVHFLPAPLLAVSAHCFHSEEGVRTVVILFLIHKLSSLTLSKGGHALLTVGSLQGKIAAAKVFHPYPEDYPKPQPPQYLGANVYGLIHNQQRQNYAMHKLLTSLQPYFARPSSREVRRPCDV